MHLLRYYFLAEKLPPKELQYLRRIVESNKHIAIRVAAVLLLGKYGSIIDWRFLIQKYKVESDHWIKRVIVFSIRKMPKAERNFKYKYWSKDYPSVKLAIKYAESFRGK